MATLRFLYCLFFLSLALSQSSFPQERRDVVHGNLIQFNENGAWCWYQDERAIIDPVNGKLVLGSDGSPTGMDGEARSGNVEAVIYDLSTGIRNRFVLRTSYSDDHNVPAFLMMPNGKYLTVYTDHADDYSRYRIFNGTSWTSEKQFDWNLSGRRAYSNLFYLSDEDLVYNFSRADRENPHIMVSRDYGETWSYLGLLSEPDEYIGYVNGYFKYWSNGKDRIDFIATEYHPRDYNTSMYHGYVKGGKTYDSFDNVIDENIADKAAPHVTDFTPVFMAGTVVNGDLMSRVWNNDLMRYEDGTIAGLIKARSSDIDPSTPSNNPDHVFFYSRFDGSVWTNTYLGRAGKKLYGSEQDYTGLGALDPNDPSTIYISSTYDPRDDTFLGVHEIFRGVTTDDGLSWNWSPVTENSTRDNLRPVVPAWDEEHTALLWFRGTYFSMSRTDAALVGIIEDKGHTASERTFLDATVDNTFSANGSSFLHSGPSAGQGAADNLWHVRTGYGNGNSVLASAERNGEDASMLKTELPGGLETGTYDIWVNFWGKPTADWRIRAGLSPDRLMVFRHMSVQTVEEDLYSTTLITSRDDLRLYQAYLGRISVSAQGQVHYVYIDDYAYATGTTSLIGNEARTWYDGISYSLFRTGTDGAEEDPRAPTVVNLYQNYPNPFRGSTRILFDIPVSGQVSLELFDLTGRLVRMLQHGVLPAGKHARTISGENLPTGLYIYQLRVGDQTHVRKMIHIN